VSVVEVERPAGGVVVLRLNRPERLNAINRELLDGLWAAIADIRRDAGCRVVILTGAGRGFCSGADLLAPPGEAVAPGDEQRRRLWRRGRPELAASAGDRGRERSGGRRRARLRPRL